MLLQARAGIIPFRSFSSQPPSPLAAHHTPSPFVLLALVFPTFPPHALTVLCLLHPFHLLPGYLLSPDTRGCGRGVWKGWMDGRLRRKKEGTEEGFSLSCHCTHSLLHHPPTHTHPNTGFVYVHGLLLSHEEKWLQVSLVSFGMHASPPSASPPSHPCLRCD